jgi:hypothetical protein
MKSIWSIVILGIFTVFFLGCLVLYLFEKHPILRLKGELEKQMNLNLEELALSKTREKGKTGIIIQYRCSGKETRAALEALFRRLAGKAIDCYDDMTKGRGRFDYVFVTATGPAPGGELSVRLDRLEYYGEKNLLSLLPRIEGSLRKDLALPNLTLSLCRDESGRLGVRARIPLAPSESSRTPEAQEKSEFLARRIFLLLRGPYSFIRVEYTAGRRKVLAEKTFPRSDTRWHPKRRSRKK